MVGLEVLWRRERHVVLLGPGRRLLRIQTAGCGEQCKNHKQGEHYVIPDHECVLPLVGFSFATASAALAVSSIAYAHVHHFGLYDPLLLRIFRWGFLLSMTGILFGIGGVWRRSSLRWHAPISGPGTLAFCVLAAEGE